MARYDYQALHLQGIYDAEFRSYDPETQALLFYVRSNPHRLSEGCSHVPRLYMLSDLGWDAESLERAVKNLTELGRIVYDDKAEVLLELDGLRFYQPKGWRQLKGAVNRLTQVPASPLLAKLYELAEHYAPDFAAAIGGQYVERTTDKKTGEIQEHTVEGDPRYPYATHTVSKPCKTVLQPLSKSLSKSSSHEVEREVEHGQEPEQAFEVENESRVEVESSFKDDSRQEAAPHVAAERKSKHEKWLAWKEAVHSPGPTTGRSLRNTERRH